MVFGSMKMHILCKAMEIVSVRKIMQFALDKRKYKNHERKNSKYFFQSLHDSKVHDSKQEQNNFDWDRRIIASRS